MGREIQKHKRRSSRRPVRAPTTNPKRRSSKKMPHPAFENSDVLVARNWDRTKTLRQNYARLGLAGRLRACTGGVEPRAGEAERRQKRDRGEGVGEVRVERDADTGRILRVVDGGASGPRDHWPRAARELTAAEKRFSARPLRDPLDAIERPTAAEADEEGIYGERDEFAGFDDQHAPGGNIPSSFLRRTRPVDVDAGAAGDGDGDVARALEAQAALLRRLPKQKRRQSAREVEWVERLLAKYGAEDVAGMARDKKLNAMQQSEGDIRRRVGAYLERR